MMDGTGSRRRMMRTAVSAPKMTANEERRVMDRNEDEKDCDPWWVLGDGVPGRRTGVRDEECNPLCKFWGIMSALLPSPTLRIR